MIFCCVKLSDVVREQKVGSGQFLLFGVGSGIKMSGILPPGFGFYRVNVRVGFCFSVSGCGRHYGYGAPITVY